MTSSEHIKRLGVEIAAHKAIHATKLQSLADDRTRLETDLGRLSAQLAQAKSDLEASRQLAQNLEREHRAATAAQRVQSQAQSSALQVVHVEYEAKLEASAREVQRCEADLARMEGEFQLQAEAMSEDAEAQRQELISTIRAECHGQFVRARQAQDDRMVRFLRGISPRGESV